MAARITGDLSQPGTPVNMRKDTTVDTPVEASNATTERPITLTCSIEEATSITGLSYDYLNGQSKIANPHDRLPGFKTGKSTFRVIVGELPAWLNRKAGIA